MKGHSERVPDKNLRQLAGRPLYHWVMMSLLEVDAITQIVVDTDSHRIADDVTAAFPSVQVRERPADLRGDMVPMHDIVARFAQESHTELILQTHSTNPLLRGETIQRAIASFLQAEDHDSLMSVTPMRARLYDSRFQPINHDPDSLMRTQDLDVVYEENSNLYIAPRDTIMVTARRIGTNPLLFPIGKYEALDIDESEDFEAAELLIGMFRR
jgi:CMP-N-acetylneuraminic acid synthetase